LQPLNQPYIDQGLRRDATSTGQFLDALVDIWFERYTPPAFGSDFEFDLVRLIPKVSEAVFIPEIAYLFQSSRFRDAGEIPVLRNTGWIPAEIPVS
jgi:hypothetical protein